ncbi:MAG: hypothetical protein MMC33_007617 [Icmadophila ericetorum]|nr:hypothetical protein [Icmadophila ericetorum]
MILDNPSSSFGSNVFAVLCLLAVSTFVLVVLRHFLPLRTTPSYLLLPIFLALTLPISIILLVPIDLASSSRAEDDATRGIWLPDRVVLVAWRIAYWLTFSLTWVILPLLGEYCDSGFRTPKDRFLYSLRSNGRYQLIVLSCGTVGLVYMYWQIGLQGQSVKSLVMALAYCWGLIQAIYLMGHGLVAVPRRLIRNANLMGMLRRLQSHAVGVHDKLEEAIAEVDELEHQVALLRRKNGISRDQEEWIEEMVDISTVTPVGRQPAVAIPGVITDQYLATLARRLNRARHKRLRFIEKWDRLLRDATRMQTIIDASASKKLEFHSDPHTLPSRRLIGLTPYTRYLLHVRMAPALRISLAAVLSLASASIVWSEIFKLAFPRLSIITLTVVHGNEVTFVGQVTASLWIFYMCTAALASLDDIKVWGNRALVRRNTYGESACWYAGQVAKLTVPLSYNFITFLPQEGISRKTTFYQFLGRLINLTPLGETFDFFFPVFILIPVCMTLFNLYGKVKDIFGFGMLDEEDSTGGPSVRGWREGRDLIDREIGGNLAPGASLLGGTAPLPEYHDEQTPVERQSRQLGRVVGNPAQSRNPVTRQPVSTLAMATQAAEEEDESPFAGFAHRLRNTLENVERPEWLPDLNKRPKWMGGDGNNQENAGGLGRWFGGRSSNGRVML